MENQFEEYVTFTITAKDGSEVEMAVLDEFMFEKKSYVVAGVIKDDRVDEENVYIYEAIMKGDDFEVQKIKRDFDYNRIAKAYMHMSEEEE